MKILFTHSYFYRFDAKQWKTAEPYPPLGTIQAAAVLRHHNHDVSLFDAALAYGPHELKPYLESGPDILVIYDDGFNYLTKMCLTRMREAAFEMIKMANHLNIPVIVSSSDATDHAAEYLGEGCDFVIPGEGEQSLLELVTAIQKEEDDLSGIKGIIYKDGEEVIRTPPRPVMKNLDELPFPAWDLVDMNPYKSIWMKNHGYFSLNIATTRGCPFRCNWCAKPIYGNRYNARSPRHVAEEIGMLIDRYDVHHFWICDDIFGLKPGWVVQFRDEINNRKLSFTYKIQSRVDLLLKGDTVPALAASGAGEVWVGAESGSQKILDAMDKGTTVEQIDEATRLLKSNGIKVCYFLQFGYPGEEKEDIRKTLRMLFSNVPDDIGISVSYPLPGTVFYERVKRDMKEKKNWTDSDDLELMHISAFPPAYYKRLHRYVHKRFRFQQFLLNYHKYIIDAFKNPAKNGGKMVNKYAKAFYYLVSMPVDVFSLKKLQHSSR